jgi:hypothetical protein
MGSDALNLTFVLGSLDGIGNNLEHKLRNVVEIAQIAGASVFEVLPSCAVALAAARRSFDFAALRSG